MPIGNQVRFTERRHVGNYTEDLDELLRAAESEAAWLRRLKEERDSKRFAELQREAEPKPPVLLGPPPIIETTAEPAEPPPVVLVAPPLWLDLGSGPRPAEGFKGVDIVPGITDYCHELDNGVPWPFKDGTVEQFRSSHFIEHIRAETVMAFVSDSENRRQDAFFWFFDEAFRIAKPGATFQLQWPALKNARAFQDPTHRRFIPAESMLYLDAKWRELQGLSHYNVRCDWVLESTSPTIPEVLAKLHPGEEGRKILAQKLSECWNIECDTVATLRARKG